MFTWRMCFFLVCNDNCHQSCVVSDGVIYNNIHLSHNICMCIYTFIMIPKTDQKHDVYINIHVFTYIYIYQIWYVYKMIYVYVYIYIHMHHMYICLLTHGFPPIFCWVSPDQITCVNTMAAGLRYCDRALTVSPSYAVECCTDPEKGGLEARSDGRKYNGHIVEL